MVPSDGNLFRLNCQICALATHWMTEKEFKEVVKHWVSVWLIHHPEEIRMDFANGDGDRTYSHLGKCSRCATIEWGEVELPYWIVPEDA